MKTKAVLVIGVLMMASAVLTFQVPFDVVVAQGQNDVPEIVKRFWQLDLANVTFHIIELNTTFTVDDKTVHLYLQDLTFVYNYWREKNETFVEITLLVKEFQLDSPDLSLNLRDATVFLKAHLTAEDCEYEVTARGYKPVYGFIADFFRGVF